MPHSVIAAQLYTVRQYCQTVADLASSLQKIRAIGYRVVQVSGIGLIPDDEVKKLVDDQGLTICNTHVRPSEALWNNLDVCQRDPFESLKISFDYLKSMGLE